MADAAAVEPATSRRQALWYMAALAFRADPVRASAALVCVALSAGGQGLMVYVLSRVIEAALAGELERATTLAVVLAGLAVLTLSTGLLRLDLRFRMEEATALLVDREMIGLTTGMPGLEQHERPEAIDRLDLLRTQRTQLGGSVGAFVENVGTAVSVIATTSLLASVDVRLLLLPLFGIPSVWASARTRGWFKQAEEVTAERSRLAQHLFELGTTGAPAKELRVFGLRHELRGRFEDLTEQVHAEHDRTSLRATLLSTATWAVFAVGYVGAITFVALEAVAGRATVVEVVLVVSLAAQVNAQVSTVYWMVGWLFDTLKVVGRFLQLVDEAAAARPRVDDPAPVPDRLVHGIDLVGVGFRYPGTDVDVLRDADVHLPAGATVAVVGDNGAGKSTIVKLLSRFYDPVEGAVLVDGVDLRRIPVGEWRARMSAGFQDFARLELLARETVGVGHLPDLDDTEAVGAALARASASEVVDGLQGGLESQIGRTFDGGVELSGGQWQKLALGRAMMREHPLLLVLDEPTAALDADTEHALFERYAGAAKAVASGTGGITLLVSHRFSTVRMADLILVVADGRVVESGTHAELVAAAGTYAELFELQARAYR